MQIITVELLNDDALQFLQLLEQLKVIRLAPKKEAAAATSKKRWAGSISKNTAAKMLQHVEQTRKEWERI